MSIPIRAISVFHTAARAGSISRAADELGVTPSAVSQQIHALEAHIGTALMAKAGRGVVLTEAGERYFARIAEEFERITEATQEVRGLRSVTTLVVRATPTLSSKWLLPRLRGFLDAQPDLQLRLDATTEMTEFGRESVDIEIRHGDGRYPGLFVEGLAEERFLPICAPTLQSAGTLAAADLPRARLIHSVKGANAMAALVRAGGGGGGVGLATGAVRPQPHGDRRGRGRRRHRARERFYDVAGTGGWAACLPHA
jgi:LysR family glycine cleavage system transcriptional activator